MSETTVPGQMCPVLDTGVSQTFVSQYASLNDGDTFSETCC